MLSSKESVLSGMLLKTTSGKLMLASNLEGLKKHRIRFKTKEKALTYGELLKVKLRNQGTSAFKLTMAQQVDAEQALKVLEETKFSTLLEAVEFSKRYAGKNLSDITISELVNEFMDMKESERTSRSSWSI